MEQIIETLLEDLNPPKPNAVITTWDSFYSKKGFTSSMVADLLQYLNEFEEEFYTSIIEFEDSDENDVSAEKKMEHTTNNLRHIYRIIMSFGTDDERKNILTQIFNKWPFEIYPQISDDIAATSIKYHEVLTDVLLAEFHNPQIPPCVENLVIRINALINALDKISRIDHNSKKSSEIIMCFSDALENLILIHPENALVISIVLSTHPLLNQKHINLIRNAFDTQFIPRHLRLRFEDLKFSIPIESTSGMLNSKITTQPLTETYYQKAIAWLGITGRFGTHKLSMLGYILNPNSDMGILNYVQSQLLEVEDMNESLPQYLSKGQKILFEELFSNFGKHCLAASTSTTTWFEIQTLEITQKKELLLLTQIQLIAFLSAIYPSTENETDEQAEYPNEIIQHFINQLNSFIEKMEEAHLDENETENNCNILKQFVNFWDNHFLQFTQACIEEKTVNGLTILKIEKLNFEPVWTEFGIDLV